MKKPIILTIDDDVDFNNVLRVGLKSLDVELITTDNVHEFTKKFKELNPQLCIIDLNLEIAIGAGFQLIEALRKTHGRHLPIIVLSRRSSKQDISLALEVGANDVLSKPFDPPLLISKIKQHLQLEGKKNELTYYSISEVKRDCQLRFSIQLSEISEFGLTFSSPHLISKGTIINVSGEIVSKIFTKESLSFMISETSFSSETNLFYANAEFDTSNPDFSFKARQWILSNLNQ